MSLWTWCFSGTGRVRRVVPIALAGAVLNLAASVFLTLRLGLVGPLLGTTVAVLPVVLWALPAGCTATSARPAARSWGRWWGRSRGA